MELLLDWARGPVFLFAPCEHGSRGVNPREHEVGPVAEIYSHSRLENFEKCPRRFQYRYRLGLPPESESIEAFVEMRIE